MVAVVFRVFWRIIMFPINEESCNVNSVGRVKMEGKPPNRMTEGGAGKEPEG